MKPRGRLVITIVAFTATLAVRATPARSEAGRAPSGSTGAALAAGLENALAALNELEVSLETPGAWLEETASWLEGLVTWKLRRGVVTPWMRSFGDGVDSILELIDPSGLLPRFNLQTYRVLLVWPVDSERTSEYGFREDPLHSRIRFHKGLDFRAERGTPVRAAAPGVVTLARRWQRYGRVVIIDHGVGVETRYAHLSRFRVSEGDYVAANALIGLSGSTGRATGPHLHFEVRQNGRAVDPERAFVEWPAPAPEPANLWELLQMWLARADFRESLKPAS